jgi:hypothetical protein
MVVCENYLPVVALNDSGRYGIDVGAGTAISSSGLFRLANLLGLGLFSVMTVRTIKSSPVAKKTLVKRAYRAASAIKSKSAMAKKAARKSK